MKQVDWNSNKQCINLVLNHRNEYANIIQFQTCFTSRTEIPALTVNRLCGSGFQSIVNGVQDILVGDAGVVLTGGSDNMSACPYAVRDIRFGTK